MEHPVVDFMKFFTISHLVISRFQKNFESCLKEFVQLNKFENPEVS